MSSKLITQVQQEEQMQKEARLEEEQRKAHRLRMEQRKKERLALERKRKTNPNYVPPSSSKKNKSHKSSSSGTNSHSKYTSGGGGGGGGGNGVLEYWQTTSSICLLGWSAKNFELYVVYSPLTTYSRALEIAAFIASKWLPVEKENLFLLCDNAWSK